MAWIWQSAHWPNFTYDAAAVAPALAEAMAAMGEVSGLEQGLSPAEAEELRLRRIVGEALASFGIEGVALDPGEIEASVIASLRHRDGAALARRSDAIASVMIEARAATAPMSAETLQAWHRLLFFGIEIEDPGRWRRSGIEIVRSAAAGRQDVLFIAPPPERLPAEMERLLGWLGTETRLPVAIRAALAHLWFETIHPFSDGNGRIGRALIEHVFARERVLPFSLSRRIEVEKRQYYQALQDGRREGPAGIDATPFVAWFLGCLARAAEGARGEAVFLLARNRYFLRFGPELLPRQEAVLRRLFGQGPRRIAEGLSARSYAKIADVSGATATRDLTRLVEIGAIIRREAGGRSTGYDIATV